MNRNTKWEKNPSYLWHLFWWVFNVSKRLYVFSQRLHSYFLLSWMLCSWASSLLLVVKFFWQILHWKCFWLPVWVSRCLFRFETFENCLPQYSHFCLFSSWCVFWCSSRFSLLEKTFSQKLQLYVFPTWTLCLWASSLFLVVKCFWQLSHWKIFWC